MNEEHAEDNTGEENGNVENDRDRTRKKAQDHVVGLFCGMKGCCRRPVFFPQY